MILVDGGDTGLSTRPNIVWQIPMLWEAMAKMGYDAISLGERDCEATTFEWIQSQSSGPVFLAGNVATTKSFAGNIAIFTKNGLKVGLVAAVSEKIIMRNPYFTAEPLAQYLEQAKKDLAAENVDFKVLLYHGSGHEARTLAKTHKEFDVILVGHSNGRPMSGKFYTDSVPIVGPGDRGRELALVTLKKDAGGKAKVTSDIIPLDDTVASSPKGAAYAKKAKEIAIQKAKASSNGTK
jgi:2',3'-cyclic-nucleotide 2'-phosphodiesterase (5'-nucleotidase family)